MWQRLREMMAGSRVYNSRVRAAKARPLETRVVTTRAELDSALADSLARGRRIPGEASARWAALEIAIGGEVFIPDRQPIVIDANLWGQRIYGAHRGAGFLFGGDLAGDGYAIGPRGRYTLLEDLTLRLKLGVATPSILITPSSCKHLTLRRVRDECNSTISLSWDHYLEGDPVTDAELIIEDCDLRTIGNNGTAGETFKRWDIINSRLRSFFALQESSFAGGRIHGCEFETTCDMGDNMSLVDSVVNSGFVLAGAACRVLGNKLNCQVQAGSGSVISNNIIDGLVTIGTGRGGCSISDNVMNANGITTSAGTGGNIVTGNVNAGTLTLHGTDVSADNT